MFKLVLVLYIKLCYKLKKKGGFLNHQSTTKLLKETKESTKKDS